MSMTDSERLRRHGERLIARGRAMVAQAAAWEADLALGGEGMARSTTRSGARSGIKDMARALMESGEWITAKEVSEAAGCTLLSARSILCRLVQEEEVEQRKEPGFITEYRRKT